MSDDDRKRKDSSVVGNINSLADKGRNLQRAYGLYKKARVAMAAGQGISALASAGGPVTVGIAAVLLVVVIILFSGAAPSNTVAGEPTDTATSSGTITPPGGPVDATNVVARLKSDFNISVVGGTTQQLISIYNYLSPYLSRPRAISLIKTVVSTLTIATAGCASGTWCEDAHASTNSSGDVTIYPDFWGDRTSTQRQYIIHEYAHVIGNTNNHLQTNLYNQVYKAGLDSSCFKNPGVIKTYPFTSGDVVHESFAESVADTITCGSESCGGWGSGSQIIQNFPSTCSNTYNYVSTKVL